MSTDSLQINGFRFTLTEKENNGYRINVTDGHIYANCRVIWFAGNWCIVGINFAKEHGRATLLLFLQQLGNSVISVMPELIEGFYSKENKN